MKLLKEYDAESILSEEVFTEIFNEPDEIQKARMLLSFQERAEQLDKEHKGTLRKFNTMLKAYKKTFKEIESSKKSHPQQLADNYTHFDYFEDGHELYSGSWIADDDGVRTFNMFGEVLACYHPILPVKRLKNLETGEEQIEIAYKRNGRWYTKKFPKTVITSASRIVQLSGVGISVTSENAKNLVRYMSDIENMNDSLIEVQNSTSKLGWNGNDFIPYDQNIVFDGDNRFKSLFDAVHERGNEEAWYEHVKELRRTGKTEIKFMLAASFASVLIEPLGGLPFFVDLWGETEGGKSVSLMLAASVWANPDESQYIGDFKTTDVALEAKADMLNHLPMMLDDTSKTSARIRDNFEGIVYDLCSGKGKSRSNKDLGINRENRWKNCIITNGERPLNSYVSQGGAINRILELECSQKIYEDPQRTAEILKKNYGFAGRAFVDVIKDREVKELKDMQRMFMDKLIDSDKMQKQAMSLSIILTADKIATESIFKDGVYISLDEAKETLTDYSDVSDNQRCYEYILGMIAMNQTRFDIATACEKWGILENGYAVIYNPAFDRICESGGFSRKAFLSWADRHGKIQTQAGQYTKQKKIEGKNFRCVFLKLDDGIEVDKDGFMQISEDEQEELPFK